MAARFVRACNKGISPLNIMADLVEPLTKRELEILSLLGAGRSNAEIAASLSLALSSVKWYAQQIYTKLGVENRRQAVARAAELGLLDHPKHLSPPETPPARLHNLPAQLTSFIGREKELAALREQFLARGARLVTLTGSGGTGKTRLALRAASQLLEKFPQGVWLVEFAPLSDPALLPRAIARALGVHEDPQQDAYQLLSGYLHSRQALLILDNCEHVVEAAAALAARLLQDCPQLRILATSREILGVEGETPYLCPSLSLPAGASQFKDLAESEAVRLFVERAQTYAPGFTLTESNAPLVERICRRIDGIPLAIELAAARTRMLSLEQIAARLDNAFRLLTGGSRSVLPRHQTLKALIDWSYNLLSEEERLLLLRLSVFAGEWTLEAAEVICADEGPTPRLPSDQVMDLLGQLIDKSLIQIDRAQEPDPRYRMLETVRQYGRERLSEGGGAEGLRERHLDYFLDLAVRAEPNFRTGEGRRWLDALDREIDNIRLALDWSLCGSLDKGLYLAALLQWLWHNRDHRLEGVEWLEKLLAAEELQPRTQSYWIARGRALNTLTYLSVRSVVGDPALARERGLESQAIFQKLVDEQGEAFRRDLAISHFSMITTPQEGIECRQIFQSLHDTFYVAECDLYLVAMFMEENDLDKAEFFNEEQLTLRKELGDQDGEGFALYLSATIAAFRGEHEKAIDFAKQSLDCFETVGNREMLDTSRSTLLLTAMTRGDYRQVGEQIEILRVLGQELSSRIPLIEAFTYEAYVAWALEEYDRAVLSAQKALDLTGNLPFTWKKLALYILGRVALSQGDYAQARDYLLQALTKAKITQMFNDQNAIQALGVLAAAQQQHHRAAILFGAQDGLASWALNILCPAERSQYEHALSVSRAALGDDAFTSAWQSGRSMTEDQVRQYAQENPSEISGEQ